MTINGERVKWLQKLVCERFGHDWRLDCSEGCLNLSLKGHSGELVFDALDPAFMQTGKPISLQCDWWLVEPPWKSILGEKALPAPTSSSLKKPLIEKCGDKWVCHYDILGLTFWCMNRLEEIEAETLDEHKRFPASESHAEIYGYLDRPVVDEWLDILGQLIQAQWPGLELKQHQFEMVLSHDVDYPARYGFRSFKGMIRAMGGDVIKRGDFWSLFIAPWVRLNTRQNLHPMDTFNTFDWIMDQSDKVGVKSTFNFICDTDYGPYEADYQLEHPAIRRLIRDIHGRGHLIGLHPSYQCYLSPKKIQYEFDRLQKVCLEEGVKQAEWGGRMHFLRWSHPETMCAWEHAGLSYDSSLGFAGIGGFRCGTSHKFQMYNPVNEKPFTIVERPLIVMETTFFSKQYMGFGDPESIMSYIQDIKDKCIKFGGDFVLLWHNNNLASVRNRNLYKKLINVS